jgi:hypothetical protein
MHHYIPGRLEGSPASPYRVVMRLTIASWHFWWASSTASVHALEMVSADWDVRVGVTVIDMGLPTPLNFAVTKPDESWPVTKVSYS